MAATVRSIAMIPCFPPLRRGVWSTHRPFEQSVRRPTPEPTPLTSGPFHHLSDECPEPFHLPFPSEGHRLGPSLLHQLLGGAERAEGQAADVAGDGHGLVHERGGLHRTQGESV